MKYRLQIGAVLLSLLLCGHLASASDLEITSLKFYGYATGKGVVYIDNRQIEVKGGEKLEFYEHDPLDGTDFDIIDIGVWILNKGADELQKIEVRIALAPKVASLVFIPGIPFSGRDPSTADKEATEKTAEWFAPILLLRKSVQQLSAGRSTEVVFEKINLKEIIQRHVDRKLWPTELRIEASVEPKEREDSFRNNTISKNLRLKLPPY
jgi:hypothetical protein